MKSTYATCSQFSNDFMNPAFISNLLNALCKVQYLGHIISNEGVATDPSKTIKELPGLHQHWCQRQQFLGFANYYQHFVKGFAKIAQPVHQLTECHATFKRTDECHDASDELRQRLTSTSILAYPDFSRQFVLDTDASDTRIGAVPSQVDDNG